MSNINKREFTYIVQRPYQFPRQALEIHRAFLYQNENLKTGQTHNINPEPFSLPKKLKQME